MTPLRSFADELVKIARASKVDTFFSSEKKDWGKFEKNLGSKRFRKAIAADERSDEKLRAYTEAVGAYRDSKESMGALSSRSEPGKKYIIKKLGSGKLGCGCKDWQYRHSVAGTDCAHISAWREEKGMTKGAGMLTGVKLYRDFQQAKQVNERGKVLKENVQRLKTHQPLIPVGRH